MAPTKTRGWLTAIRTSPALSAWPFVVVILTQMAVGSFSVYTLSTIRAYVTDESLWSKGQHEAVYYLNLYLETKYPRHLESFNRTIAIPLAYQTARKDLEETHPDLDAAGAALRKGGSAPEDIPGLIWMFRNFHDLPYFKEAVARWEEADQFIRELDRLGKSVTATHPTLNVVEFRDRVEAIDAAVTPRAIAFSSALDEGARVVERLLMLANLALAGLLAGITVWRVGKVLAQRRQIENALVWQASHDELTGLANRRAFEERLLKVMKPTKDEMPACALLFIDLDQFKIVNDTCGHAAGDALLRRICPPLQDLLGPDDFLARLGGDEFSMLIPRTDLARALIIAESVRANVEQVDFVWNGRTFNVTASVGLVHDQAGVISPEEMMSKADMACFMAKEKGRNRVHSHREEDQDLLSRMREMNWVQRIHQALNEDRFCLYAQEIVALTDKRESGIHLELLIRMRDETGFVVPPSSFLPAAERFGLIRLIDRWVVRSAFEILAERMTMDAKPITCCGINLSGATLGDDAFPDFLKEAFAEFGVPPHIVCFEVTETSAIVNLETARVFIRDLQELGCTFALDDFGSGMSSFSYLKELPVDYLKIDGSFVKNLLADRSDRAMVEMISHVGHIMGKRIIAEFVETAELATALREIGVDYAQGHGIAYPKPFDASFKSVDKVQIGFIGRYERLSA